MIRGRRAHGAALATLATCAHLSPDNQARLHRAGSVPCKPKTPKPLKMSAYGTLSLLRDPQGSCQHPWALPTPAFATWQGCRENLLHPYHRALGRLQPVKAKPQAVASQALTGFQLRPLRSFCYSHGGGEGSRAAKPCILPLTPWSRPNTSPQGQVVGFNRLPRGAASEVGVWGKAPRC